MISVMPELVRPQPERTSAAQTISSILIHASKIFSLRQVN